MMKIAIAGTNGLAQFIAYYLGETTSNVFVFTTRKANAGFTDRGWQLLVVDYDNHGSLLYSLKGIDVIISTINGPEQLALIKCAALARVRLFIPSAFSGPVQSMPSSLGNSEWQAVLDTLKLCRSKTGMRSTIFTCGVFFERFGPGGLNASQISTENNRHAAVGEEGSFLVNMRAAKATLPVPSSGEASICLTSARDLARYIVACLKVLENLSTWPAEFKLRKERVSMSQLLKICSKVRGGAIDATIVSTADLYRAHDAAVATDGKKALALAQYIAVAEGNRTLTFSSTEINLPPDVLKHCQSLGTGPGPSETFESWLTKAWATPQPTAEVSSRQGSGRDSGRASAAPSARSASSRHSKKT